LAILHVLVQPWDCLLNEGLRQLLELLQAGWTHELQDIQVLLEGSRVQSEFVEDLLQEEKLVLHQEIPHLKLVYP